MIMNDYGIIIDMLIFCYVFHVTHGCIYAYVIYIIYSAHFLLCMALLMHHTSKYLLNKMQSQRADISSEQSIDRQSARINKLLPESQTGRIVHRTFCSFFPLTAGFDNIFKLMQMVWQGPQGLIYLVYSLFNIMFFQHGSIRFFFFCENQKSLA